MQRLSLNFGNWMRDEVAQVAICLGAGPRSQGFQTNLSISYSRSCHDIKGQAHTMGFPLAGLIAGSMCELIERMPDPDTLPVVLLRKHVQAISAVVKEDAREEDNVIGKALAEELSVITEEFIAKNAPPETDNGS